MVENTKKKKKGDKRKAAASAASQEEKTTEHLEQEELTGWEFADAGDGDQDLLEQYIQGEIDASKGALEKKTQQHLTKHQKKARKKRKEQHIRDIEARRRSGFIAPTNAAEFEQMVMSSPNSSYVWIQYMAYLIAQGEVDKARGIAQRAIHTISFREQHEKFNVWLAWINTENIYGDDETLDEVFQKAMSHCSQSKLLKSVLDIFQQTHKIDRAEKVAQQLCKLYSDNPESWIRCMKFWLMQDNPEEARKTFDKSMQALPARHHIHMASQAALVEFKFGDAEKGRSIMERILQENPRRTDLWSVYLDQEVAHGDQHRARALFQRCIHLTLAPKKMKFLFKKYLEYEKKHGDDTHVEFVKKKAMEYVERALHTTTDQAVVS